MFRWLLMTALLVVASPVVADTLPNQPVPGLDMARYLGEWHEIAHVPIFFQGNCVDTITATFTADPDGTLRAHNVCRTRNGRMIAADGVAKKVEGVPGALKVRFVPGWLAWLPKAWTEYWVIDLDADYQWAVIGGPTRKHLWVLSRDPAMNRLLFEQITQRARERGYPVDELVMTAPLD